MYFKLNLFVKLTRHHVVAGVQSGEQMRFSSVQRRHDKISCNIVLPKNMFCKLYGEWVSVPISYFCFSMDSYLRYWFLKCPIPGSTSYSALKWSKVAWVM